MEFKKAITVQRASNTS